MFEIILFIIGATVLGTHPIIPTVVYPGGIFILLVSGLPSPNSGRYSLNIVDVAASNVFFVISLVIISIVIIAINWLFKKKLTQLTYQNYLAKMTLVNGVGILSVGVFFLLSLLVGFIFKILQS